MAAPSLHVILSCSHTAGHWAAVGRCVRVFGCLFRIADPDAAKPEDWDEDAPRQVPDEDADKPEGWLDDEPAQVDDPGVRAFTCGVLQ